MRHDFSASFLQILPPDTNFGEAWESLCLALLRCERGAGVMTRLNPPDLGVDLLAIGSREAYQCKSDERGAFGTLDHHSSLNSLSTAMSHQLALGWSSYRFATNANYSGAAFAKLRAEAATLGLDESQLGFLGPEYWDELCTRHFATVKDRFRYRIVRTGEDVVAAFQEARYRPKYVAEFERKIAEDDLRLVITNNLTEAEIEIPFARDLTVENYVDAARVMLGITLDRSSFPDLATSAGPSISVTIDKAPQGFSKKIAELPIKSGEALNIWIKLIWRDESDVDQSHLNRFMYLRHGSGGIGLTPRERAESTLSRTRQALQETIWSRLRATAKAGPSPTS